jgi:hypothetical protein
MGNFNWKQQFVLVGGLALVVIQFFVAGQFSNLWNAIWNGTSTTSSGTSASSITRAQAANPGQTRGGTMPAGGNLGSFP